MSGSHDVGKTTLIDAIGRARPEWRIHEEITRTLMPLLGYESPYDIVAENGIAMYEAAALSHWCTLTVASEYGADSDSVEIVDRSPIDSLGYYFLLRKPDELVHEKFLTRIARAYISKIHFHIFIPRLPIVIQLDSFQREQTQTELEAIILELYSKLDVRYARLSSVTVEDRMEEALTLISRQRG